MEMKDIIAIGNTLSKDDIEFISKSYLPVFGRSSYHNKEHIYTGTDKRYRTLTRGAKGHQSGDHVWIAKSGMNRWIKLGNWTLVRTKLRLNSDTIFKGKILFRYYTKNNHYINYHARVVILDGEYAGKKISVRY